MINKGVWFTFLFLILIFVTNNQSFANEGLLIKKMPKRTNFHFYAGLAIGQETFISAIMPKLGLLATASFGRPDIKLDLKGEFPRYCFYGATDISMFMPVPIMSATVYSGIKVGSFTFDNSIAFRRVLSQHKSIPNGPYVFTVNPKIGVKIAKIWFKLGTSYKIGGDLEEFENWMKIGNLYCNFDLNYILPIKNP